MSQITIDYTNCDQQTVQTDPSNLQFSNVEHYSYDLRSKDSKATPNAPPRWAFVQNQTAGDNQTTTQTCYIQFDLPADLEHSVFLYYKLTNFYQNHRRYVKSLDTDQLRGHNVSSSTLDKGDCAPLATVDNKTKSIYPCGLIANSMFNGRCTAYKPIYSVLTLCRHLCQHHAVKSVGRWCESDLQFQ